MKFGSKISIIITITAVLYITLAIILSIVFICAFLKRPQNGWPNPMDSKTNSRAPFLEQIKLSQKYLENKNPQEVFITSFDNYKLAAQFIKHPNSIGTVILMHGFQSRAFFEFSRFCEYFYQKGYSLLLCDQRTHGKSEGKYITLGIKERQDCLDWINFLVKKQGTEKPIYLCGVSMGCSTVLMVLGYDLPENVKGVIADCGFTSPDKIIEKVLKTEYHLPATIFLPFINFATKTFCDFDLKSYSTLDALKNNRVPILFVHGTNDDFVPFAMSQENYDACTSQKSFLITKAKHAANFLSEPENYEQALDNFMQ